MNTHKRVLRWLVVAAVLFHVCVLATFWRRFQADPGVGPARKSSLARNDGTAHRAQPRHSRTVYPFSIVPGGIQDLAELKSALMRDELVSRHLADFDLSKARFQEFQGDKKVFVSYRVNNKVYWTKGKVRLSRGETLISDGKNLVRARCGNRISEVAQSPVSPAEPDPEVLDTPTASEKPLPLAVGGAPLSPDRSTGRVSNPISWSSAAGAGNGGGSKWIIPGLLGGAGGVVARKGSSSRRSIAAVPEPAVFPLLGSALGCYLVFRKRLTK
jgi:hypothetical protein